MKRGGVFFSRKWKVSDSRPAVGGVWRLRQSAAHLGRGTENLHECCDRPIRKKKKNLIKGKRTRETERKTDTKNFKCEFVFV